MPFRKLFAYSGGQKNLMPCIMELLPEHTTFVEVFFGGGSLFFNKDPSEVEIINDIDKRLINLLKVVKDRPEEFERELRFLPNSRDLFKEYKAKILQETDDVKRAAMFYYILHNTWSGSSKIGQWVMKTRNTAKIDELSWFADRLRHVNIENLDCVDLIKKYDGPSTWFYMDPPYADIFDLYEHSFQDEDHMRLARALKSISGMFLLTYNSHPLIEMLYKGYPQFVYETKVTMSPIGKGEIRRMESHLIVANYDIVNHNFKRWRAGYFQL